ncbi:glycosyltransferase family 4 protein [Bacillus halotolerans]|uniref:glycosyltransferase family 4 protein n=1 Tax=Bacillus halotolerans TaxID=260554 RepID=UPI000D082A53|nr:glycosyltransferase family 4 protein [Bacillus halotolerans]MCY7870785.1 glycosyltransferase family 4 protein [Bacillus spizizenii]PSA99566.1 glycosyl transferase family 1 [Bacillus halotolerans]
MQNILVLNFFPTINPPNTGGTIRYFNIYYELSKFYDITLLSQKYTPDVESLYYSNTFKEIKIPTDNTQNEIDRRLIKEKIGPRFSTHAALSCALIDEPPPLFLHYYTKFYKDSSIIIHESPFMLKYDVNFGKDNKMRIYNSHNHESEFAKHVWYGRRSSSYVKQVTLMERTLVNNVSIVFATSIEDKKSFVNTFEVDPEKIKLAPNGVNPKNWIKRKSNKLDRPKISALFIGSLHQPNIEIVEYILSELAVKCTEVEFIIAGECGNKFSNIARPNVKILGEINNFEKIKLFSEVDVAINPAFFGTGTKIKTLEFLSAGIPLISTEIGVKGMNLQKEKHYFHAIHENFAHVLMEVSRNSNLLEYVALEGQRYINNKYSWEVIAANIRDNINESI